jgi:L-ascorbate metabolism protein UlaG (beta-lactamase superfamily)
MELTWHGHSTWRVVVGDTHLLVDPFFDNPKTDLDAGDVEPPDYVLLTHGHADHIADATAFPEATLVATPEITAYMADEHGHEDAIGMNLGGTVECGDAYVTMHRPDSTPPTSTRSGCRRGSSCRTRYRPRSPTARPRRSTTPATPA